MAEKEIKVKFNTITPLWTGDAWQDNREIRPSSLLGSLRFWFEVICYFSGICNEDAFRNGRFEKEVDRKKFKECLLENGNSFEAKIKCLLEQGIPLPSIVFGTTNWKSLIRIEEISKDKINRNRNYPYWIGNMEFPELKHNNRIPNWLFKKGFYGSFEVIFKVEEYITKSIFYPLLTFMDKYGFWGGKWNIGYGRLEVLEVKENENFISNWKKTDFETFDGICFSWKSLVSTFHINISSKPYEFLKKFLNTDNFYCKTEREFGKKIRNIPKHFIFVETINSKNKDYESIIKSLSRKKLNLRDCLRPEGDNNLWKTFRHRLLGEQGEGSKILPFIHKENEQLKAGFLSVAGLLNLEGVSDG